MPRLVNTVRVQADGRCVGFNTDAAGFARDLKEKSQEAAGKKVALIGAGGGAQAVAAALAQAGPRSLSIYDIDARKAARLVQALEEFYPKVRARAVDSIAGLKIGEAQMLVNATPVGMKEADPLLVPVQELRPELFVYDLIYNPAQTKLIAAAREAGCRAVNGSGMLLHQGCLAFEHWMAQEAPVEVMRRALEEVLDGRSGR
jgi:shikimate dehydrogenase